jgi:hypothetical protein
VPCHVVSFKHVEVYSPCSRFRTSSHNRSPESSSLSSASRSKTYFRDISYTISRTRFLTHKPITSPYDSTRLISNLVASEYFRVLRHGILISYKARSLRQPPLRHLTPLRSSMRRFQTDLLLGLVACSAFHSIQLHALLSAETRRVAGCNSGVVKLARALIQRSTVAPRRVSILVISPACLSETIVHMNGAKCREINADSSWL